jgi:hypothetical protein
VADSTAVDIILAAAVFTVAALEAEATMAEVTTAAVSMAILKILSPDSQSLE